MQKFVTIVGLGAAICVAGLTLWRIDAAAPPPPPQAPVAPVPVLATKVGVSDFPSVKSGIGSVMAYNVV
ncbi:MAG: hypothetical protein QOK29_818, partial [Rhodospirillaceae bacterium]|nr:hypothetical protein [Rhodospirillaceae bacterium]